MNAIGAACLLLLLCVFHPSSATFQLMFSFISVSSSLCLHSCTGVCCLRKKSSDGEGAGVGGVAGTPCELECLVTALAKLGDGEQSGEGEVEGQKRDFHLFKRKFRLFKRGNAFHRMKKKAFL